MKYELKIHFTSDIHSYIVEWDSLDDAIKELTSNDEIYRISTESNDLELRRSDIVAFTIMETDDPYRENFISNLDSDFATRFKYNHINITFNRKALLGQYYEDANKFSMNIFKNITIDDRYLFLAGFIQLPLYTGQKYPERYYEYVLINKSFVKSVEIDKCGITDNEIDKPLREKIKFDIDMLKLEAKLAPLSIRVGVAKSIVKYIFGEIKDSIVKKK